jgi:signal transduction histidine kinase
MTGAVRRLLRPLFGSTTYRRGIYLLLGGVLLLPYLLLAVTFSGMIGDPRTPLPVTLVLASISAAIGLVPAFLRGTRALEISAVRLLLGVDLPDPPAMGQGGRVARETRMRGALWFAVHLAVGGTVGAVLLVAVPFALAFLLVHSGPLAPTLADLGLGGLGTGGALTLTVVGLILLVGVGYAVAGLGALAAVMAPVLLGPSASERIAALEADARRLAERNRLARELHDSVGHALTVTVLQASAAGELLDRDPEFVRRALAAIEDTGRAAMDDLDHVLGVLREEAAGRPAPHRTLADLPRLVAEVRATDRPVTLTSRGAVDRVPAALSREGYRLAQEGLTNALRHAGGAPVTVQVTVAGAALTIDVANPLPTEADPPPSPGSGVGLAGMRERVTLLGGRLEVGPAGDRWRVRAELPLQLP